MTDNAGKDDAPDQGQAPVPTTDDGIPLIVNGRRLSETEITALREARDRRDAIAREDQAREVGGAARDTNPTRYGDWEKAGRAIDFS
ncbi:hypothetical protein PB2503_04357 [Parvularcula bermudensis HTCC2503]|uniref:DUF1674 domain-containing protein n=1 Tax=Parvularcula bermudensis (strain ATCC BAA-594 / HTCC2503 / KCTC 12087) TaxID=314260 RepID=E0TER3_PARBH|nr:DUF1674 domain-containing protein [Parvularcula bermudensis]ADM08946.1 hypothetical protein PB2503_04357 [Parvularcula bermudensis HTCC2503]